MVEVSRARQGAMHRGNQYWRHAELRRPSDVSTACARCQATAEIMVWGVFGLTSAGAEGVRNIVGRKACGIGKREHVGEGDRHPLPASGLAADHGQRGSALR